MRFSIIKADGLVAIDGVGYANLDLSFLGEDVHAVQWYGTSGEIERKDPTTNKMIANDPITAIAQFQPALDAWVVADTAAKAAQAAQAAQG